MPPRRWLHGLYVYPNSLTAVRLTGSQVRDVLEHSARYHDGLDCGGDGGGCTLLTDPSIPVYNVDSMAGVSYRIDPTRAEGDRIRDLSRAGLPLPADEVLTVVVNNYRAAGGGGYPHLAGAEAVWRDRRQVTELIEEFLSRHDPYPALAYAALATNVSTTIVHGRILMEDRRLLTVDIEEIKREVLALTEKIKREVEKL